MYDIGCRIPGGIAEVGREGIRELRVARVRKLKNPGRTLSTEVN